MEAHVHGGGIVRGGNGNKELFLRQSSRDEEREDLTRQLTALKSLLRLDAEGVRNEKDLLLALEETRTTIARFSLVLSASQFETRPPPSDSDNHHHSGIICVPPSPTSKTSSPRSSWPSSPTTSATSFSPRDSLKRPASCFISFDGQESSSTDDLCTPYLSLRRPVSCFARPPLSPSVSFDFADDDEIEEEQAGNSDKNWETPDESFRRLSSILASLQAQAEAAVSTPSRTEFDDEDEEDMGATRRCMSSMGVRRAEMARVSTLTPPPAVRRHRHVKSMPYTPTKRLHSCPGSEMSTPRTIHCFASSPSPESDDARGAWEQLEDEGISFSPSASPPPPAHTSTYSDSTRPTSAQLRRRRAAWSVDWTSSPLYDCDDCLRDNVGEMEVARDVHGNKGKTEVMETEGVIKKATTENEEDWDLEGLVADLLEGIRVGEQDAMFQWVWVWLMGGGVVWVIVGWALGWGSGGAQTCVCP